MPPGKVLQPVLKMKVDELFLCWLSEAGTQAMLQECLRRIQAPVGAAPTCKPGGVDRLGAPRATHTLPLGAAAGARSGAHARGTRRSAGARVVSDS